jgi:predicted nucleotidyltransferase
MLTGHKPSLPGLSEELADQIVRRIRSVAVPEKIVLFGSRARGDHRPDSDVDLLIVQKSNLPRHRRSIPIRAALSGLPIEVDLEIVMYTPAEIEEWSRVPRAFVTTALREGRVLYENPG